MKHYQKNLLIPLLMAIVMMAMSPTRMWAVPTGSGTEAEPYLLSTADDFSWVKTEAEDKYANSSGTFYVKVNANLSVSSFINFKYGTWILDLNGKSIVSSATMAIQLFGGTGTLTVKDSSTEKTGLIQGSSIGISVEGSSVTIVGGTIKGNEGLSVISSANAKLNGGTFISTTNTYAIGASSWSSNITCDGYHFEDADGNTITPNGNQIGAYARVVKDYDTNGISTDGYQKPASGDGSTSSPYQIANAGNLAWFRDKVNSTTDNAGLCAKLTADIDLSAVCHPASDGVAEVNWVPIAKNGIYSYGTPWNGTFDGDGHKISNLYANYTGLSDDYIALIGRAGSGSVITKLQFDAVNVKGYSSIGAACGYSSGEISNVEVLSGTVTGNNDIGGIAGWAGMLKNCTNRATVSGRCLTGGICGQIDGNIENCSNYGAVSITFQGYVAGIAGSYWSGDYIKNCVNYGTITTTATEYDTKGRPAAIIAYNSYNNIENCANFGNIYTSNSTATDHGMMMGNGNITAIKGSIVNGGKLYINNVEQTNVPMYSSSATVDRTNTATYYNNVTAADAATGKYAYLLQSYCTEATWGQNLSAQNSLPTLGAAAVYATLIDCDGTVATNTSYSNNSSEVTTLHNLTYTEAHAAVGSTDGNSEYYTCSVCHMHFSDANAEHEIADGSWVIKATGSADDPILLSTAEDFAWMYTTANNSANSGNTYYVKVNADYSSGTDGNYLEFRYGTWVLDLNGKTINIEKTGVNSSIDVYNTANLTIKDSSTGKTGLVKGRNEGLYAFKGYVTIEGGTFEGNIFGLDVEQDASVTLHGGTFRNTSSGGPSAFYVADWNSVTYTGYRLEDAEGNTVTTTTNGVNSRFVRVVCSHSGTKTTHEAAAATETADAHAAYYTCDVCGAMLDAGGNEITLEDITIHNYVNGICTHHSTAYQPATIVYAEGSTTVIDHYAIGNAGQLLWFMTEASKASYDNKTAYNAELTADIVINQNVLNADGTLNGTPAISWIMPTWFFGKLDGQNHTISGIYFNKGSEENIAMFYYNYGTICRLGVVDSYFKGTDKVSTFAAQNQNGVITDCFSKATIDGTTCNGGIAGWSKYAAITNCYYAGKMTSTDSGSGPICSDYEDGDDITNTAVHNNYFLASCLNEGMKNVRSTSVTAEEMASGKVACLLQNGRTTAVWGQTLTGESKQNYPVLGGTAVYASKLNCDGSVASDATFTNDATVEVTRADHVDADNDGFCDQCGHLMSTEAPVVVTAENYETLGLTADYIGYKAISNLGQLAGFAEELNAPMTKAVEIEETSAPSGPIAAPKRSGAKAQDSDDSPQADARKATTARKANAPRRADATAVPTAKYVLTADIVVNSNLFDEDGAVNEYDEDNKFRTLIAWNSPRLGTWDEDDNEASSVIFDGNDHKISGIYQNVGDYADLEDDKAGQFGFASEITASSVVKNLGITGSYFTDRAGWTYMGCITGYSEGTIENCWSDATIDIWRNGYNAGLVGYVGGGKVTGSSYTGTINLQGNSVGADGIVNDICPSVEVEISDCNFSGKVVANGEDCYFAGISDYVYSSEDAPVNISNCYADGKIVNNNDDFTYAGLAWYLYIDEQPVSISNCYNAMTISNSNAGYLYGLVYGVYTRNGCSNPSQNSSMTNCFNYGDYSDAKKFYPLVEVISSGLTFTTTNCYYLAKASNSKGGKTAAQFASGEVAYRLNGNRSEGTTEAPLVWYQTLGESGDAYPVLEAGEDAVVYPSHIACDGSMVCSNTPLEEGEELTQADHEDADHDGFCDVCHNLLVEDPVLVTDENYATLGLTEDYVGYKAISNLSQLAGYAEELEAPITKAQEVTKAKSNILVRGTNHVSVKEYDSSNNEGDYIYYFTPNASGNYYFSFSEELYASMFDYSDGQDYYGGTGQGTDYGFLTCNSLEAGTTYEIYLSGEEDYDDVTVTIKKESSPRCTPRRAEETTEEPVTKYVLTADIALNKNLFNEDGTLNEYDEDGEFRTDLFRWNSPVLMDMSIMGGTQTPRRNAIPSLPFSEYVFDGNGHTISGLYQNSSVDMGNDQGALGFTMMVGPGSSVKNLKIKDSYFYAADQEHVLAGSIASMSYMGNIENCESDATVEIATNYGYAGGIVGVMMGGAIADCSYNGRIAAPASTDSHRLAFAGIVGSVHTNMGDATITGCNFSGTATTNLQKGLRGGYFAGIVGASDISSSITIDKCWADGEVVLNNNMTVAGIATEMYLGNDAKFRITNSYNAMKVTPSNGYTYYMAGILNWVNQGGSLSEKSGIALCFSYGEYDDAEEYEPIVGYVDMSTQYFQSEMNLYLDNSYDMLCAPNRAGGPLGPTSYGYPANAEGFASGEFAYMYNYLNTMMNQGGAQGGVVQGGDQAPRRTEETGNEPEPEPIWYQEIGVDKYPVLKGNEWTVVYYDQAKNKYYNLERKLDEYELVDGVKYDLAVDIEVADFKYTRTFYDNDFNCLYVPFSAPVSAFTDCSIYAINMFQQHDTDDDGEFDELTLEVVKATSGTILPNHPYLIKYTGELDEVDEDEYACKTFSLELEDATLAAAAAAEYKCSSMNADYTFQGTYSAIDAATATTGKYYTLITDEDDNTVLGPTTTGLKAQRWFMTMTARDSQFGTSSTVNNGPIRIVVQGDTDGIENLSPALSEGDFCQGAKCSVRKYMENGKVVIVRNGKKYNLNGQVIQ